MKKITNKFLAVLFIFVAFVSTVGISVKAEELVQIAVQFRTPPSVALRQARENMPYGFGAATEISFEEEALAAHAAFHRQMAELVVPFGYSAPQITGEHHRLFNGVFMSVPSEFIEEIISLPEVYAVFPDTGGGGLGESGGAANLSRNEQARELFEIENIQSQFGFTGQGVKVGVLDTGVDYNHPAFVQYQDPHTGRIRGSNHVPHNPQNALAPDDVMDLHNHGTHVSGTVVAMAPDVELWHFRVMDHTSAFSSASWVIAGLEAAHIAEMDIVCLSLGTTNKYDPLGNAYSLMAMDGIIVVVAASNPGSQPGRINPSAHVSALPIYVANGTTGGTSSVADTINNSSGRGPVPNSFRIGPDIAAPGTGIMSTWRNGSYGTMTGTSMAAPAVAGIAALMKNAFPYASANEIKTRLINTARPLEDPNTSVHITGAGFIQPLKALTSHTFVNTVHDIEFPYYDATVGRPGFGLVVAPAAMASFSFGSLQNHETSLQPINPMLPDNIRTITATINNTSDTERTYSIDYHFINNPYDSALITLSRRSITVPAYSTGEFSAAITVRELVPASNFEGIISVTEDDSQIARLPFSLVNNGFTGSIIDSLTPVGSEIFVHAALLNFEMNGAESIDPVNVNSYIYIMDFLLNQHHGFSPQYGGFPENLEPSKTGHTFLGWYTTPNFEEDSFVTEYTTMPEIETTLFAKWESNYLLGDANQDGRITSTDSTVIAKFLSNNSEDICQLSADLDGDGLVTTEDLSLLAKWLIGIY